ncbi:hypothetical protein KC357_g162 [Hortaea werneckii]|nr:hypothetical protein KC357_g162 [Hortaea werneckii]
MPVHSGRPANLAYPPAIFRRGLPSQSSRDSFPPSVSARFRSWCEPNVSPTSNKRCSPVLSKSRIKEALLASCCSAQMGSAQTYKHLLSSAIVERRECSQVVVREALRTLSAGPCWRSSRAHIIAEPPTPSACGMRPKTPIRIGPGRG